MTTYRLVPVEPSEEMWGGIARDIVMWMRMTAGERGTGASLHQHLRSIRGPVPDWLAAEIPDTDRVPPKGTVAVVIYKAMLQAAPATQNELLEAAKEFAEAAAKEFNEKGACGFALARLTDLRTAIRNAEQGGGGMSDKKGDQAAFIERLSKTMADLQREAFAVGLPITAQGLNSAMNAAGWEASGNIEQAIQVFRRHTDLEP